MENYSQFLGMKKDLQKAVAAWRKRTAPQKSIYAREYPKCSMSCAQMEKRTATISFPRRYPGADTERFAFYQSNDFRGFRAKYGLNDRAVTAEGTNENFFLRIHY